MKILYLTRDDGTDVRGVKICNSLARAGHEVVFVGWDRTPGKKKDLNFAREVRLRILARQGAFGKNSLQGWGDYGRHVLGCLYEEKPDAVQAVNEEKAALVLPFKGLLYRRLVVDVYDSVIANRYRTPWMGLVARICRWLTNARADCIIETGSELQAMLGAFARKSLIIENVPYDPGPAFAARVPTAGPIRLSLGGSLARRRMGLDILVQALDLMPAGSVVVEATGWLVDDYARNTLLKHPAVRYQWLARPVDFLNLAGACDALLYLRGDAGESAYRAAVRPNRVFDALAVGRPIIINPELTISRWVERDNLGIVLPRFDPPSLAAAFHSLRTRRAGLPEEAARLRKIFLDGHVWPVMEKRLNDLYRGYERSGCRQRAAAGEHELEKQSQSAARG